MTTDTGVQSCAATSSAYNRIAMKLALGGLLVLVWGLFYNLTLHVFYERGAINDTYLLAGLIWRNELWDLQMPYNYSAGSFAVHHRAYWLLPWNWLSYAYPFDRISWAGVFFASMFTALLAVFLFVWLKAMPRLNWRSVSVGVLMGGLWLLSPTVAQSWPMLHFEYWQIVFIAAFLWFLAARQTRWAVLFFVLSLTVREDAPLHLLVFLGATALMLMLHLRQLNKLSWWDSLRALWLTEKPVFVFSFLAVVVVLVSLVLEYQTDQGYHFSIIYSGNPAWAHLSWGEMGRRFYFILTERSAIWVPWLICFLWGALVPRHRLVMAGAIALLPWFAINMVAVISNCYEFHWYYGYPFMMLAVWPAIALRWLGQKLHGPSLAVMVVMALSSVLSNWGQGITFSYNQSYLLGLRERAYAQKAALLDDAVLSEIARLGEVRADYATLGLLPNALGYPRDLLGAQPLEAMEGVTDKSLFFFPKAFNELETDRTLTAIEGLHCYPLGGTQIWLATTVDVAQLPNLTAFIEEPDKAYDCTEIAAQ